MRSTCHIRSITQLLIVVLMSLLIGGCATRSEIKQFQADHQEFRGTLKDITRRLENLETRVDTIYAVLGGNVQASFEAQEELLRSLRADSRQVTNEFNSMIETLGARISDSDVHMRRLLTKLDEVSLLVTKIEAARDSTNKFAGFDVNDPEKLYQQSYLDFTQGESELARFGFSQYLELYPKMSLADNALYWIGETFMAESKEDSALVVFQKLEKDFPDSKKIPTAMLKQGLIKAAQGERDKAFSLFTRVVREYPMSPEAAQAKTRLEELDEAIQPE